MNSEVAAVSRGLSLQGWAALMVAGGMFGALAGAWYFQYGLGYVPCPLCYEQRIPYYAAIALALAIAAFAWMGGSTRLVRLALVLLALVLLVSAGLGVYHAGVEWKFWQGPSGCAAAPPTVQNFDNILESIRNIRAVPCDEAAWRLFGISLAGYNALISAALALVALGAARAK